MKSHALHKKETAELGFWLYLMTDIMLFGGLFATFMVLRHNTNGGVDGHELFDTKYALIETFVLLGSSLMCGLALLSAKYKKPKEAKIYLGITLVLGAAFLAMELYEFWSFVQEGHSWQASAFLSAFFTLVGTHGLHITIGLIWGIVLLYTIFKRGFTENLMRKLGLFTVFWHFLELVWIFIFTVVYLIGGTL